MKPFSGLFTALITPFTANDKIDFDSLSNLIDNQIKANVDGVVVLGTTGEAPNITPAEAQELLVFVIQKAKNNLKVVAGTGSASTKTSISYSQQAQTIGVDGLLVINPYYNKPTQEGLYQHFKAVADNTDIPILLYNIKGRSAVNLETNTLVRLSAHPRIVGIKEASGNLQQIMDVINQSPKNFTVLSGDDSLTYPIMTLGGNGVVSVLSNIMPEFMKKLVNQLSLNHWEKARNAHYQVLDLMRGILSIGSNPIAIKTIMAAKEKIKENFRLPLCSLSDEEKDKLYKLFGVNYG